MKALFFLHPLLIVTILSVQIRKDNEQLAGISSSLNANAAAALSALIVIKNGLPGLYIESGTTVFALISFSN